MGWYKHELKREPDLHSFIICNEAERIPLDLQITILTLGPPKKIKL